MSKELTKASKLFQLSMSLGDAGRRFTRTVDEVVKDRGTIEAMDLFATVGMEATDAISAGEQFDLKPLCEAAGAMAAVKHILDNHMEQ